MEKTINWGIPTKMGVSSDQTMESRVKAQQDRVEQINQANAMLQKALPPMTALLETRLKNKTPLKIMRALVYESSGLQGEEEDDGFYTVRKSEHALGKFVDTQVEVPVGEVLIFKSLYPAMQEFIFEDSKGKEHAISFDQKNKLMTCTDIYETVAEFMGD